MFGMAKYKNPLLNAIEALDLRWISLRFKSVELQRSYDQHLIDRGLLFGARTQVALIASSMANVVNMILKYLFWLEQKVRPENDDPNWMQLGLQCITFLPAVFTLTCSVCGWWRKEVWFPRLFLLLVAFFIVFQCIVPELYMALAWPRYQLDMPTTVILGVSLQFLVCFYEGDFFDKLILCWIVVALRIMSFSVLLANPNLNDFIPDLTNSTFISIASELPQFFASAMACTIMGYWQTIMQKSHFYISMSLRENSFITEKTKSNFASLVFAKVPKHPNKDKVKDEEVQEQQNQTKEKSEMSGTKIWIYYESLKDNLTLRLKDDEYQIFAFKTLISMFKPLSFSYILSFGALLLQLNDMEIITKVALLAVYSCCIGTLTYFAYYWSSRIEQVVPWVIVLMNKSIVILAFVTFLPSLATPLSDAVDSFHDFAGVCQSAVILCLNLTILAGLQWYTLFIYVQVLSIALIVKFALLISATSSSILFPFCFLCLFLCCSQVSLFVAFAIEVQLYEFFKMSSKIM